MRIMSLLVPMLILSGCAINKVHEDFSLQPNTDEGMIVLSTRTDSRCGSSGFLGTAGISFNAVEHGEVIYNLWAPDGIGLLHSPTEYDFSDPPGYFYARPVKAGDYRFGKLSKAVGGPVLVSTRGLDMDFHVEAGKIYYLGEIFVSIPDCSGYSVRINDQRQRDGLLFNKKMKKLNSSMFEYQILKQKKDPTPFADVKAILPSSSENVPPPRVQAILPSNVGEPISSTSPAQNPSNPQAKFGKYSYVVEKMAKANGCQGSNGAYLTTAPGPVENYSVACDGVAVLLTHCEYGACKPLK